MTIYIYDTMTRRKEAFVPLEEGKVNMYVCGPTVYNYIHIGNARPVVFFDTVYRYLLQQGYEVRNVVNFTDVDDKLIKKAEELGEPVTAVADRFIQAFLEDAEGLGVHPGVVHPRVTENIPEIVAFIDGLVRKGFAYAKEGDVFFRAKKFAEYGKLSHQKLDELQFGIRIEVDPRKEHPQDFVLWKQAKPGEISWSSPWGEGRPGWHIECSAMAAKYLGETIDIHGGGQDLTFPHHECEIAQSEALYGKPMARYWMHNGYVNINNEKMSKSLANGVSVVELRKQHRTEALRFFILSAHYRNPLNFSDEVLRQAEQSVARIENCVADVKHRIAAEPAGSGDDASDPRIEAIREQFHHKMRDDFNTPDAITAVFDLVSFVNGQLKQERANVALLQSALELFYEMDSILGIIPEEEADLLDADIERLIEERTEARKAKNWARADEIRDMLANQGIVLEDTPQGIRWKRK